MQPKWIAKRDEASITDEMNGIEEQQNGQKSVSWPFSRANWVGSLRSVRGQVDGSSSWIISSDRGICNDESVAVNHAVEEMAAHRNTEHTHDPSVGEVTRR